ncbi:MAG: response regulator receiver protein [Methanoregulaceae archaeon]
MMKSKRQARLLELFMIMTRKTRIVEPMSTLHGTPRDNEVIEREIALIVREILDLGLFKTKLRPIQIAQLITRFHAGKNDTEIARDLGDERLSKTIARARVRLRLLRDGDFRMPFDRGTMEKLLASGKTMIEISRNLKISPSTLREYRHVIDEESDPAITPYLERIRDVIEDQDPTGQMPQSATRNIQEDSFEVTETELIEVL